MAKEQNSFQQVLENAVNAGCGSGMSAILSRGSNIIAAGAAGTVKRFTTPARQTPERTESVTLDTVFDLASLTKPFVAAALLTALQEHGATPDMNIGELLPELDTVFAGAGHTTKLRVRDLLTHTAGFPPSWLSPAGSGQQAFWEFRKTARPISGTEKFEYSCVGFIWLGLLLDTLVAGPNLPSGSGLRKTIARVFPAQLFPTLSFCPALDFAPHCVATEWDPKYGMLQGVVHDETARRFGGVSGNAGLFGSAWDVWGYVQALQNGSILTPLVRSQLTTQVPGVVAESGFGRTLGLRVNEKWCAALANWNPGCEQDGLFSPAAQRAQVLSHTGFTGTAWALNPTTGVSLVLLTNRVHPSRDKQLDRRALVTELLAAVKES